MSLEAPDVLILGVPADRIRALGEAWSDGGLWDDVLYLALLAWAATDDHERRMRWHHLVMAAGNFKRQNGRRLRPSRISPAGNVTFTARSEQFFAPHGIEIGREDADSWQQLQNSLAGAGAAMIGCGRECGHHLVTSFSASLRVAKVVGVRMGTDG